MKPPLYFRQSLVKGAPVFLRLGGCGSVCRGLWLAVVVVSAVAVMMPASRFDIGK